MKTDKELLEIWEDKELSFESGTEYEDLDIKEKIRIFDIIIREVENKK